MQGINQRIEGSKMILEIDLNQNFGKSSTGKSDVVASSGGFQKLAVEGHDGLFMSVTVGKSLKRK